MNNHDTQKIKIHRKIPIGILTGETLPHSFVFDGSNFVCYVKSGTTTDSLGYGKTKEEAFNDLVSNKRKYLELDGVLFEDWLHQFNLKNL